ncbi:MAG: sporulation protein YabP [Sporolactobacillus sp.]
MSAYYPSQPAAKEQSLPEHEIVVKNRKSIAISGVKHVESFDHEEFLMETVMGYLAVKGAALKMQNLNVEQGAVSIEGQIFEICYLDGPDGEPSKGFFGKLFR